MNNFSGFLNMFFNSDFFSVVIVILILVLLTVLSYLIKSQKVKITELEKKTDALMKETPKSSAPVIEETKPTEVKKEATSIATSSVLKMESLDNTRANIVLDLKAEESPKEEITYINPIEEYEKNEEDNAVISAKELEAIEKERDESLGKENNAKLIEEYEENQEKKAIISYNELIKNASSLELNYIEKPKVEENAPLVKQVEIKEQSLVGVTYNAEEEYLKILKEFRASLVSSG